MRPDFAQKKSAIAFGPEITSSENRGRSGASEPRAPPFSREALPRRSSKDFAQKNRPLYSPSFRCQGKIATGAKRQLQISETRNGRRRVAFNHASV